MENFIKSFSIQLNNRLSTRCHYKGAPHSINNLKKNPSIWEPVFLPTCNQIYHESVFTNTRRCPMFPDHRQTIIFMWSLSSMRLILTFISIISLIGLLDSKQRLDLDLAAQNLPGYMIPVPIHSGNPLFR